MSTETIAGPSAGEPRTPTEVELTLRLDPRAAPRLLRDPLIRELKQGPQRTARMVSTYFDTPDFRLQRQRAALRVRQIGKRRIQTLKLPARPERGVIARREWERSVSGDAPELGDIESRHVRELIDGYSGQLAPVFTAHVRRSSVPLSVDGSTVELAVDIGEIKTPRGVVPICEAELELKSGDVDSLYHLAQELNRRIPLSLELLSKSERGYALATSSSPPPRRAEGVRLGKDLTAGEAFQRIARSCLLQMRANAASIRAEPSPDGIHQLRVAARRLRSAMAAFDEVLPRDERRRLNQSVRWIAQSCGRAREYDVFISDIVKPLCARYPGETALQDLMRLSSQRRDDAYAAVGVVIESREFTDGLLAVERWVEAGKWRLGAESPADRPIAEMARVVLKRLHKKLLKAGRDLDRLGEQELHALRIRAKKLRYASEFFRDLFRAKATKAFVESLAGLQDRLGALNDSAVSRQLLADLEAHRGDVSATSLAKAAGAVLGWNAARIERELKTLPKAWEKLEKAKPFWR